MPSTGEAKHRQNVFRDHKRKGRRGTVRERNGKLMPAKAITAARKARAKVAQAAGVDVQTLAVLTPDEIKERIALNAEDIAKLNGIASGRDVPRNSVSIIGAQKLKLSVAGLLTQNLNITGSLTAALEQVQQRIAQNEKPGAADHPQEG